ncbi:hypothetical protein Hanom_Chr14g01277181 [Helianthus anomalus]
MSPFQHLKPHAALKNHYGQRYGGFIIHPMICLAPDTIVALSLSHTHTHTHIHISITELVIQPSFHYALKLYNPHLLHIM